MHFYGTILTLTVLPAGVLALPPRSTTARNTGDASTIQNSQAPGAVFGDGNCTGMEHLSLPCVIPSLIEIGSNDAGEGGLGSLSSPQSKVIESNIAEVEGLENVGLSQPKTIESNIVGARGLEDSQSKAIESNNAGAGGQGGLSLLQSEAIPKVGKFVSAKFGSMDRPSGEAYPGIGESVPSSSVNNVTSSLVEFDFNNVAPGGTGTIGDVFRATRGGKEALTS